jgi:hypothetical protein
MIRPTHRHAPSALRRHLTGWALALVACAPGAAHGDSGFNLSWDDCGTHGIELKTFACNSNTGSPFTIVGSFRPPEDLPEFVGLTADVRVVTGDALPDWWKHGAGQCRGTLGFAVSYDFTAHAECIDFWTGQAAGGFVFQPGYETPNQARVVLSTAVPFENRGPIEAAYEYYAFKMNLRPTQTTGSGSCAGCDVPATVTLREMQLFQPPDLENDPILTTTLDRGFVRWQGTPIPPVEVLAIAPTAGASGSVVTITGTGFAGATSVVFGGFVWATFTIVDGTEIHATVPYGARTGPIRVNGVASPTAFTAEPHVQSFAPVQAPIGHEIEIHGFNFLGTTAVAFAGTPTTFTIVDDTEIHAPVPAGATDGPIGVTNPAGTGSSSTNFRVGPLPLPPVVTDFTPRAGAPGQVVTILGDHFVGVSEVRFGFVPTSFTTVSATEIHAPVPALARTGRVTVTTSQGSGTSDSIYVVRPVLSSIAPAQAPVGHTVELRGHNFTRTLAVRFAGVSASFEELSDGIVRAVVPAGATSGDVEIENAGGVASRAFVVGPLSLEGINLSWDDCGAAGTAIKDFACTSNSGAPFAMVGSFVPPPGLSEYLGLTAQLTVVSSAATMPDWWSHGSGRCRGTSGLAVNFDFSAGPFTCVDFFQGLAAGGFVWEPGIGGPDRARMRLTCAIPFDNRGPLDMDTEYYAFKVNLQRSKSTGSGACAGCDVPASITLDEIQLFQPPELAYDPVVITPLHGTTIHWQNTVLALRSFTPTTGAAGTLVTIRGFGFTGATAVRFNHIATTFTVTSDSVVVATVPEGPTRGHIEVVTPEGVAVSADLFNDDTAPPATPGVNLSWSDCGPAGTQNAAFACDTDAGPPFTLVGSFGAPAGVDHFVGLNAQIDIGADGSLPSWWQHGSSECRGTTGLAMSVDFVEGPFTCVDPWAGAGAGGFVYEYPTRHPDQGRIRITCALPLDQMRPVPAGAEYYAFKVSVQRAGTSSCSGCSEPMCLILDYIQLFQPPEYAFDPLLTNPIHRNFTSWQSTPPSCPASTPTLAGVADVRVGADRVTVVWQTEGLDGASVQRRRAGEEWRTVADLATDGLRRITYEDRDVVPGAVYGYRLRVTLASGEHHLAETVVTVPSLTLALERAVARHGALAVSLALPSTAPATLELYDVSGRRWASRRLAPSAPGSLEVELRGAQPLRAGVYFVRLRQDAATASLRTVIVP